jgi:ATP-dependent DNA helicase RecQ
MVDRRVTQARRTAEAVQVAEDVFGWRQLRPGQRRAMQAVIDGRDALALMPTGYGKSAIYQVAGAVLGGVTIVVSPLIALQADQIDGMNEHARAPKAFALNSAQGVRRNRAAMEALESGEPLYLLLAPEQLANDENLERIARADIRLFVVDEAHCVSRWGHDFRPDYLRLGEFAEKLGRPPLLAMTATAAPPVRDDIVERLGMVDPVTVFEGFDRPNLFLEVVRHERKKDKAAAVVEQVKDLEKPGLLYVATRKSTEKYRDALQEARIRADHYHGAMPAREREAVHERFLADESQVVVATSAFGMGIDKPDVRFVVHADTPDSIDTYYQEIGRAGRDGLPAAATLHYREADLGIQKYFAGSPDAEDDDEQAAQRRIERSRVEMLRAYAETRGCRRQHLLAYFGEVLPEPCGNCDNCRSGIAYEVAQEEAPAEDAADGDGLAVGAEVEHVEWGRGTIMERTEETLTAFFEESGYRTLSLEIVREKDLLLVVGQTGDSAEPVAQGADELTA